MKRKKWLPVLVTSSIMVSALVGCTSKENVNTDNKKIKIAAAENFYGEVAQAVGGDRVEVKSLITSPTQDPHEYEATTNDSKTVADSQVIIYNGIGYDSWMEKIITSNSSHSKQVIAVANDLLGKKEGDNEHVWYDPSTFPKLAEKVAEDLASVDPNHAADYRNRAESYKKDLASLQDKVNALKQTSNVPIDVSEPIFNYMAAALHLKIQDNKFAQAIDQGTDPSPVDIAAIQDDIKNKKIKFFVYNKQNASPTVDHIVSLAKENNVPVVTVTETKPAEKTYIQWMNDQLDQIEKALHAQ